MTNTSEFHELAERARIALEPTDDAIERIGSAWQQREVGVQLPSTPPRSRRARWAMAFAMAACIGAASIVAISALDQTTIDEFGVHVPLTAPQAFAQAAAAAADEEWHPLVAGEYHHVYSLDVLVPQDPWSDPDDIPWVTNEVDGVSPASATESWIARDGSGRSVGIQGLRGGDPDSYMDLSYDKYGRISGGGWSNAPADPLPIHEQLRHADQISTFAWDGPPTAPRHTHWYRQPDGYISSKLPGWQGYIPTSAKGSDAEKFQTMAWGNTIEHFDQLNELSGPDLTDRILQLVAKGPVPGQSEYELGGDTYGAPREVIATEERIARAVRLLGAAPLAPHVRAAIFEWLAQQDPVQVVNDAEDVVGRRGTRVTFKAEHERVVPGHTWSIEEIVAAAEGKGQPVIGRLEAEPTYEVESYTEYRKWYVDVIFDEQTGRLLQEASHIKWGSDGAEPSLTWSNDKPIVTTVQMRPETGVVGMGTAYLRVDRTTDFTAASSVCREHPEVCS